jgi:diketogulonate reductase-like aldo/keto reductase
VVALGISGFPIDYSDRKPVGNTGETTSAIGLGTWAIRDYSEAKRTFIRAIEEGIDLIDTAEIYDSGNAEVFVGEVAKEVGRDNLFIITKLPPSRFFSEEMALKAARASLRRLNMRYVDLILIHWPDYSVPIERLIRNLERLAEEGLTRYIGVSNFSKREVEEARWALKKYEIVADQVRYSVLYKEVEKDLLPYAIRSRITIQAYTPLERGRVKDVDLVRRIASKYEKSPVAVALNYLISKPMVVAIVKTERLDHLMEIREALGWRLSEEDIKTLAEL